MSRFIFLLALQINCFLICLTDNDGIDIFSFVPKLSFGTHSLLEPYVNKYCDDNFPPGFVYYGCCSEDYPKSHCFLNDDKSRDAFCETQNLHANRFSYNCSNSIVDKNCTLPKGRCYCCSPDAPTDHDNRPTRPPQSANLTDPSFCGTIATDQFFGGNYTLAHIMEQTAWELPLFSALSFTLEQGTKFVNVMNPNCRVTICHIWKTGIRGECLHFTHDGQNSYRTDKQYNTVSISCGCMNGPFSNDECTKPENVLESDVSCQPQNLDADTCAVLYQESGCQSCNFDPIRLTDKRSSFTPSNFAVIRSLRVNSGCSVRASAAQDFVEFYETTSIVQEFFLQNTTNAEVYLQFNTFDCICGPKTIIEDGTTSLSGGAIAGIVLGLVVLVAAMIGLTYFMKGRKHKVSFTQEETEQLKHELFNGGGEAGTQTGPEVDFENSVSIASNNNGLNEEYSVKKQHIEVFKDILLGRGNYGVIFKGSLFSESDQHKVDCAIKTVDELTARIDDLKLLMNEIRIMSCVGRHENVIQFLGFYCNFHPKKWEFLCLMELCVENLHSYLLQARNCQKASNSTINVHLQKEGYVFYEDTEQIDDTSSGQPPHPQLDAPSVTITQVEIRKWSAEIANGMDYLTMKNLLHIDLATRNVLLSANLTVKISDFGLSKKLYDALYYKKVQGGHIWIPMKWSSFESLMGLKFSKESDIWSYGVTIWEIFSLGEEPYPDLGEMVDLIRFLNSGQRLPCPKSCDDETYALMKKCWEMDPTKRPSFNEIGIFFKNFGKEDDVLNI
ncbi:mast/stem cell growth factor receptor Kit isoform X2 [Folsomia candida]|uniref:mast/stem cell growth factor receptor Kit isoform X2 n=1 Tax=Folsomia candida TaxID=158441 RepID=UPI000B909941|nr:mast/stem cell growth factor receptor Kit isoform X2 [Folsomia candida]